MAVELALPVMHIGPGAPGQAMASFGLDAIKPSEFDKPEGDSSEDVKKMAAPMFPPEIGISEDLEKKLSNYLSQELWAAQAERGEYIRNFARWQRKYRTKFPEFPKDWPIANASQIVVPIIKLTCHTLTSRVYQTIMSADPLWAFRTKNPAYQDFVTTCEDFLGTYAEQKLDIEEVLDNVITEVIKMGTAVAEVTTCKERKALYSYDPLAQKYNKKVEDTYSGAKIYNVPIEDFWIRLGYQDVQKAPWCGKELRLTWSKIKEMALAGELDPDKIDKVWRLPQPEGNVNDATKEKMELEDREPMDWYEYQIFELCLRWDCDGDGIDEEIIVYYHWDSRTVLRKKYNTFKKGRRPWVVFRYIRVEHQFFGEGVCEILEMLQDEISTIHNQRIDNATVANLQIILVKRLIRGLSPGDRLWTGKIVKVQDVGDDVGTLRLGEVYPSTVNNETMSLNYARELGGAGEAATGQAQPVTRTTATAQIALLEELNRRFDKTTRGLRKSIKEMGAHVMDLLSDHGTYGLAQDWLGDEAGFEFERLLADPRTFMPNNARIVVLATKSTINREVEFQSAIAVMNLVTNMGQQMLQLCAQLAPEAAGQVAHELVRAIKGPWRKVMQYSDSSNIEEATAVLGVLERVLPAPEDMGGMAAALAAEDAATAGRNGQGNGREGNGGGGTPPGNDEAVTRMASLMSSFGQGNPRSARMAQRG